MGHRLDGVAPGQFRTDFAGRSLTQVADYAETAGLRRIEHDTAYGTRQGDPARAARAMIVAVESPEPPALLLLGTDALDQFRDTGPRPAAGLNNGEASRSAPISATTPSR